MAIKKGDLIEAFEVVKQIYPVGSLYFSVSSIDPSSYFGGTWKKVSEGRVIQGSDSKNIAGTTKDAGLPNITGTFSNYDRPGNTIMGATGAFAKTGNYNSNTKSAGSDDWGKYMLFDASRSNAIYGRSDTVQPPAFIVNIWQRIA